MSGGPSPEQSRCTRAAAARAARWVRPEIRRLEPYHVADPAGMIKLDAMENPYAWPPSMRREWLDTLAGVDVNRYPDPGGEALKEELRASMGVPADMRIVLGNGSDELIQIIQLTVAGPGRVTLAPVPTFAMYEMTAAATGGAFESVPLDRSFRLDAASMLSAIERTQPACVFLAYPNNPTGNLFDTQAIEAVIAAADGLVVIDEAYHAFARESFLPRLTRFDNVVVMRTLSKIGLAGLRLGFLVGPEPWLSEIDKVRLPYNISVLTQVSVAFALRHLPVFEEQAAAITAERERVFAALSAMTGLQVFPSVTNFLLLRVIGRDVDEVFRSLLAQGVLVRNFHRPGGALQGCLRVSIGSPAENNAFLQAMDVALAGSA